MTLSQQPGTIFVHDPATTFSATAPCRKTGPNDATCPDPTVRSISISGSSHNDSFDVGTLGYPATISGNGGDDFIRGGLGNDHLNGNDGNDTIDGGPGADRIAGGRGTDTVTYAARTNGVSVSLDSKADDGEPGERDNVVRDVENVIGGAGNDVLLGGTGSNNLQGGPGNDRIDGGSGSDVLDGGPGIDTLDYSSRFIGVNVNLAANTATTFGETDRVLGFEDVIGSRKDDRLTGDAGPNRLSGGAGNDVLDGGLGQDIIVGGSGFDTATYAGRNQPLEVSLDGRANDGAAGEGDNVTPSVEGVIGGNAADVLRGNSRSNTLRGGAANDTIFGNRGHDVVDGGAGADRLFGGPGSDQVTGGAGRDLADGGKGNDLVFTRGGGADRAVCGPGTDTAFTDRRDRVSGCEHVHGSHR